MSGFFSQFEIPIFNVTLFVSFNEMRGITKANWKKFRKDFETYFEADGKYGAVTAGVRQKQSGAFAVLVCFKNLDSKVILHESTHIAKRVMDICHIEDEEVEAYLTPYIVEQINEIKRTAEANAHRKRQSHFETNVYATLEDLFC